MATPSTTLSEFEPFMNGGLARGLSIVMETTGACGPSLVDLARDDAVRCTTDAPDASGATVQDPCFADGGQFLACTRSPENPDVVRVEALGGIRYATNPPSIDRTDPWVLVLTDGDTCVRLPAAPPEGTPGGAEYGCTNGVLTASPDRSQQSWGVALQTSSGGAPIQAHVAAAYF